MQSMETRHFKRTKLEQEQLQTECESLERVKKHQVADLEIAAHHAQIAEGWAFDKEWKMRDEEWENAKNSMVAKTIEKDHSNMIINQWKELDKMAHSPIQFIWEWARALAEQYAAEEGFEFPGESLKGGMADEKDYISNIRITEINIPYY